MLEHLALIYIHSRFTETCKGLKMVWQTEMVRIVRHLINDIAATTYADDRLEETVLVSAQLILNYVEFDNTFTVDVDSLSLSPDPTALTTKDNAFINIVCIKAACVILSSELRTHGLNSVSISDGPSRIDMTGVVKNLQIIQQDMCQRSEHAIMQHKAGNSVAGQAILGPYAPGAANVSRITLSNREGYFS